METPTQEQIAAALLKLAAMPDELKARVLATYGWDGSIASFDAAVWSMAKKMPGMSG